MAIRRPYMSKSAVIGLLVLRDYVKADIRAHALAFTKLSKPYQDQIKAGLAFIDGLEEFKRAKESGHR